MYPETQLIRRAHERLFIALWPGADARDAVADYVRQWGWPPGARITPAARLHATLHFIGDVPAPRLDELQARLDVGFESFDLRLAQPEVWKGGSAVLCADATPAALDALHGRLAQRLRELGLPVEQRPLRVHLTLARRAQAARLPPPAGIDWPVQQGYALVRSLRGGAGYETVKSFR